MADAEKASAQRDDQSWTAQSSDLIRFKQFTPVKRGSDQDEVREYLAQVASWFDDAKQHLARLERERRELLAQREALMQAKPSEEGDPYQQLAARMADVLRAVDQHAQTLRREVDEEARRRTEEAERQADRIRDEAEGSAATTRQEAERFAKDVRTRAEELLGRLTSHRMAVRDELQGLHDRAKRLANQLHDQISVLEGGMKADQKEPGGGGGDTADSMAGSEESDTMLSYASDDLLIVLPDLVPTVDQLEDDRAEDRSRDRS
jgi:DivIVA domain-containing protein